MLDVCLLGTGGMMPLPRRKLTALMTRYNGSSMLIDCGEGTQVAIKEAGWSFKPIDVICFTHFHADHISGLPGLLLTMGNAERKEDLLIIGPKNVEKVVNPPQTPVVSNKYHALSVALCLLNTANKMPIMKQPNRLTAKVPHGKP